MKEKTTQPEFWESAFSEKQEMWGWEPALSAVMAKDIFIRENARNILVPGFGYGRNARLFGDNGMTVTGIEISQTAIELAGKYFGPETTIYHGSVTDMPFDVRRYDGIFCYALIHLLDTEERKQLIASCYNQLETEGQMIFTAISKEAATYGTGRLIGKDRYELFGGVKMYFYDRASIAAEFGGSGLFEVTEVGESYPFFFIRCRKG